MEACKKPCVECPFRIDSAKGYLGGFSIEDTMLTALSDGDFKCHLTRETDNEKHCAGRLLFAKKSAKSFRDRDMDNLKNEIAALNPNYRDEVLAAWEFKKHHNEE